LGFPGGPWILVVGMHRSGTSVLSGILGGLGLMLPGPDDLWDPEPSNPEHFESKSMVIFDEHLFEFLGGSWHGPPDLSTGWETRPELRAFDDEARRAATRAFSDEGPVVWKDPRACLLLPYWQRLLPGPLATVFIWRSPVEVARSLQQRDGFTAALGAALWERYNRAALDALVGTEVYVTSYDELMGDPVGLCHNLGDWLDSLEGLASRRGTWDLGGAAGVVTETLRHQSIDPDEPLLDSHEQLAERLRQLAGAHRSLPAADLAPPSPWGTAIIEEHRLVVQASRRVGALEKACHTAAVASERLQAINDRLQAANERLEARSAESSYRADQARRTVQSIRASTSWRLTRPLRAISARRFRDKGAR
jgi:hypothetical protein